MSELTTLARPYAAALFRRALETGRMDQWSRMLEFLATAMADRELAWMAVNPNVSREDFLRLLLDLGKGFLDGEGENFARLLVHNGRISLVGEIRTLFERYRAEHEGYTDVEVITAYPLDREDQNELARVLERHLGKKVRLEVDEDRSLIGGVIIRSGDRVIDGSVRGRLQRLAKRLHS